MPAGLQIWDSNGILIHDQTTPVVKLLGTFSIGSSFTGPQQSGTIVDSRFTQYPGLNGYCSFINGFISIEGYSPTLSISGNTLTWSYPRPDPLLISGSYLARPNCTFIYWIQ